MLREISKPRSTCLGLYSTLERQNRRTLPVHVFKIAICLLQPSESEVSHSKTPGWGAILLPCFENKGGVDPPGVRAKAWRTSADFDWIHLKVHTLSTLCLDRFSAMRISAYVDNTNKGFGGVKSDGPDLSYIERIDLRSRSSSVRDFSALRYRKHVYHRRRLSVWPLITPVQSRLY